MHESKQMLANDARAPNIHTQTHKTGAIIVGDLLPCTYFPPALQSRGGLKLKQPISQVRAASWVNHRSDVSMCVCVCVRTHARICGWDAH